MISQKLDELNLVNFSKKTIASPTTVQFSTERRGIMGNAPKTTKLIQSKVDYQHDWVTFYFLTEATEKYGPDYQYKDVQPEVNFQFERNPSKTYEIQLRFFGIGQLQKLIKSPPAAGVKSPQLPKGKKIVPVTPPPTAEKPAPPGEEPEKEVPQKKAPVEKTDNEQVEDVTPGQAVNPDEEKIRYFHNQKEAAQPNYTVYNMVKNWLWMTDFAVWSNAPSFHWQGFNYNLSILGASIFPTNIEPKVWDKVHGNALIDKHLYDLFLNIAFFINQMASSLLNKIRQHKEGVSFDAGDDSIDEPDYEPTPNIKYIPASELQEDDIIVFGPALSYHVIEAEPVPPVGDIGVVVYPITADNIKHTEIKMKSVFNPDSIMMIIKDKTKPIGDVPLPSGEGNEPEDSIPEEPVNPFEGDEMFQESLDKIPDFRVVRDFCDPTGAISASENFQVGDEYNGRSLYVKLTNFVKDEIEWVPISFLDSRNDFEILFANNTINNPLIEKAKTWCKKYSEGKIKNVPLVYIYQVVNDMADYDLMESKFNEDNYVPQEDEKINPLEGDEMFTEAAITTSREQLRVVHLPSGKIEVYRISKDERGIENRISIGDFVPKELGAAKGFSQEELVKKMTDYGKMSPKTQNAMVAALNKSALVAQDLARNDKYRGHNITIVIQGTDTDKTKGGTIVARLQGNEKYGEASPAPITWDRDSTATYAYWRTAGFKSALAFNEGIGVLQSTLMDYNTKKDEFSYIFSENLTWKERSKLHEELNKCGDIQIVFGTYLVEADKNMRSELRATMLAAIQEFVRNERNNFDTLSIALDLEEKENTELIMSLKEEIELEGFDSIIAINQWNETSRLFFIKKEVSGKMFPVRIAEAGEIKETLVCTYGTFTPIVDEHISLLKHVVGSAKQAQGSNIVFVKPNREFSHDEMSLRQKAQLLKNSVPDINICTEEGLFDIFDAFVWAYNRHYKKLVVIVGSNQVADVNQILEENNGKEAPGGFFEFDDFKVLSYGKDNPDDSQEAMEARNAIMNGDIDSFVKAVQGKNIKYYDDIKKLYNILRYELRSGVGAGGV